MTDKDFLLNLTSNQENLQVLAKTPGSLDEVFKKAQELSTRDGIDGGAWLRFQQAFSSALVIRTEAAAAFSDDHMFLLYKDYFQNWFDQEGFRDQSKEEALHGPFASIQQAFTSTIKNHHHKCLEYLLMNAQIANYDIDGLGLAVALGDHNINVLFLLWKYADKENYSYTGALGDRIRPEIRRRYQQVESLIGNDLRTLLLQFKVLREM